MKKNKGQTLVILIVFMAIMIVIVSAVVTVTVVNSTTASRISGGEEALKITEAGAENGVLRLIRNPNYTGETLTIGDGSAKINVTGTTNPIMTVVGTVGSFRRVIEVRGSFNNNVLTITSWKEL